MNLSGNKYQSLLPRVIEKTQVSNHTSSFPNTPKDQLSKFFVFVVSSSTSNNTCSTKETSSQPPHLANNGPTRLQPYLVPFLPRTQHSSSFQPSPDFTGTIIFGVIASVLAIMTIIIGYLQLRKVSSPAIPLLPITLPAPLPAPLTTQLQTPAPGRLPPSAPAPAAKEDV
jgi:hypothetical protein